MTHDNQVLFPADSAVVIRFAKPRAAGGASSTAVPTVSRYCGLPPHRRASAIAIKRSQRSSSSSRPAGLEHAERAFVVRRRLIEGQTGERPIARPARVADRLGGVGHLRGGESVVRQLVDPRAILDVAGAGTGRPGTSRDGQGASSSHRRYAGRTWEMDGERRALAPAAPSPRPNRSLCRRLCLCEASAVGWDKAKRRPPDQRGRGCGSG